MRRYELDQFGVDHLRLTARDSPTPGPHEVRVEVHAMSLNYRDLLVVNGDYNPRLQLPVTPISDGAGVITAIGGGVTRLAIGDRVMTHFIAGWIDGPYRGAYLATTLGTPGAGVAAEEVILPVGAVLPMPLGYGFAQAATLPIAALTAWSALVTEGGLRSGQTVLTLGTGGVSIFALQIAKASGARVIITSSSDEKLDRARELGADETINYVTEPRWDKRVLELTDGEGADVVVENGGVGTLGASLRAVRAGGVIALLGALTGLKGEVNIGPLVMRRVRVAGVLVDSRDAFEDLVTFIDGHHIAPMIDSRFAFDELPAALNHMAAGKHFGKIVVER